MAIPAGTKFQGIPPGNDDLNKRSAQANATAPLYDASEFGGGAQTVQTITPQGTDNTSTSQAIYGINVIDTATTSALAVRLPDAITGQETTFVNNSTMSISVFPSVVGGKINGIIDGVAYIPNDGQPYTFSCVQNPLPGAWVWSPPAVSQIQLPRISISHTQGSTTNSWGVGVAGAQSINPTPCTNWFDCFNIANGVGQIVITPGQDFWATYNLSPLRTITVTKVYTNVLSTDTDGVNYPQVYRHAAYPFSGGWANQTASSVNLNLGLDVANAPLNSPVVPGDQGTRYIIQQMASRQVSPPETDLIGVGADGSHYLIYNINIPFSMATKTYDFDIFIEHT